MATAGLQLGYGGDQSLAAEISEEEKPMEVDHLASMVFNVSSEAPIFPKKKVYANLNQSIANVLDIWKKIEKIERELLGKIQERLDGMNSVVSRANNIHKSVKNDLGAALTYTGRLEREREKTTRSNSSLRLMLASFKSPAHIMTNKLPGTPETNKRKVMSPPIAQSTEKKRREKDKVLIAHNQIPQKSFRFHPLQLPQPPVQRQTARRKREMEEPRLRLPRTRQPKDCPHCRHQEMFPKRKWTGRLPQRETEGNTARTRKRTLGELKRNQTQY